MEISEDAEMFLVIIWAASCCSGRGRTSLCKYKS